MIFSFMSKSHPIILPNLARSLADLGRRLKRARIRRNLTAAMVAERAGISLPTLRLVERGSPSTSLAVYAQVLLALDLAKDLDLIAQDDELGLKLQELNLPARVRPKTPRKNARGDKS